MKIYLAIGCTVLTVAGLLSAPAQASDFDASDTITLPAGVELVDAEMYAKEYQVTVEEAGLRLGAQEEISRIEETLLARLGSSFTYLRILHNPEYLIEIGVAEGDETALSVTESVLDGSRKSYELFSLSSDDFKIRTTTHLRQELEDAADSLTAIFEGFSGRSSSNIDIVAGRIDIYTDKVAEAEATLGDYPQIESLMRVHYSDQFAGADANAYAGLSINGCTSAFSVKNSAGTKGILTAAHCNNSQSIAGQTLTYVLGYESGNTDAQWHKAAPGAAITFKNWAKDNSTDSTSPGYRVITSTATTYTLGTYVCAYKKTTGYDCGEIAHLSYDPDGPLGKFSSSFMMVENTEGGDLSEGGDSGSGWFTGNKAYAVHYGHAWPQTHNALIGRISSATGNLGVSVLTSS